MWTDEQLKNYFEYDGERTHIFSKKEIERHKNLINQRKIEFQNLIGGKENSPEYVLCESKSEIKDALQDGVQKKKQKKPFYKRIIKCMRPKSKPNVVADSFYQHENDFILVDHN